MAQPLGRVIAAFLAAAALIAGCGDSGDGDDAGTAAPSGDVATASPPPPETGPELAPGTDGAAPQAPPARPSGPAKPDIVDKPIPFGADRKRQMSAYSKR